MQREAKVQIEVEIDGAPPLVAHRLRGEEAISTLFRFEVDVASATEPIDAAALIGKDVALSFAGNGAPRTVHGIVTELRHGPRARHFHTARVVVGPAVEVLRLRSDCRIFQELAVDAIVDEVLKAAGVAGSAYRFELSRAPPAREFCVQYRESDWAFVNRILEDEGIFYYFVDDGDACTLVFADDAPGCPEIAEGPELPLVAVRAVADGDVLLALTMARRLGVNAAALRDYNFSQPRMDLGVEVDDGEATRELFDYPGGYEAGDRGAKIVRARLDAELAGQAVIEGRSTCPRLAPGHRFAVDDLSLLLPEELVRGYLVTAASHRAVDVDALRELGLPPGDAVAGSEFQGIPDDVTYRPPRRTPRPVIAGAQTAIVTGSEEIFTDKFGRIKVHFHWDRHGAADERSSCWIRVSQPWAGRAWGAIFLPRRDDEVIVEFLEGDPDRPIVTGRVYNGDAPPPCALPGERTKSTIRTRSSPEGSGFNELRFEDLKDSEEIYLHAQRDSVIEVEHDERATIGNDAALLVKRDRSVKVDQDQRHEVGRDVTIAVHRHHGETIDGDRTITVHGAETATTDKDQSITVGGARTVAIKGNEAEEVDGDRSETTHGAATETIDGDKTLTIKGAHTASITGDAATTCDAAASLKVQGELGVDVTGAITLKTAADLSAEATGKASLKASADLSLEGLKAALTGTTEVKIACGAASITLKANGDIVLSGVKISLSGADLKLSAPKISTG